MDLVDVYDKLAGNDYGESKDVESKDVEIKMKHHELVAQIETRNWVNCISRATTAPEEVKEWVTTEHGDKKLLPLHAAVKNSLPSCAIRHLMNAYPDAVRITDADNFCPIHYELSKLKIDKEVLEILIDAYPESLDDVPEGCTPIINYDLDLSMLYRLIEMKEWDKCVSRIAECPEEAKHWIQRTFSSGQLRWRVKPIHTAILLKSPVMVLKALLKAYPEGARCYDDLGMLPIHVAMRVKCDDDVVGILLKEYPEGAEEKDPWGRTLFASFDFSCSVLFKSIQSFSWDAALDRISSNPEEARTWVIRNQDDGELRWKLLPIHAAIIFRAPLHVVESLLVAYPQGALYPDDRGMTPLHFLAKRKFPDVRVMDALLNKCPKCISVQDPKGATAVRVLDENHTDLFHFIYINDWVKAVKQIETHPDEAKTWVVRMENDGKLRWRVLPIHLAIATNAPTYVVFKLLKHYPQAAKCQDDRGLLPLHLAFKQSSSNDPTEAKLIIDELIRTYPQGVSIRDNKDRIPMTHSKAILSNLSTVLSATSYGEAYIENMKEGKVADRTDEPFDKIIEEPAANDNVEKPDVDDEAEESVENTEEKRNIDEMVQTPAVKESDDFSGKETESCAVSQTVDEPIGTETSSEKANLDNAKNSATDVLRASDVENKKSKGKQKSIRFKFKKMFGKKGKKQKSTKAVVVNGLSAHQKKTSIENDNTGNKVDRNNIKNEKQGRLETVRDINEDDLTSFIDVLSYMDASTKKGLAAQKNSHVGMNADDEDERTLVHDITTLIKSSETVELNDHTKRVVMDVMDAREDDNDYSESEDDDAKTIQSTKLINLVTELMEEDQDEMTIVGTVCSLVKEIKQFDGR